MQTFVKFQSVNDLLYNADLLAIAFLVELEKSKGEGGVAQQYDFNLFYFLVAINFSFELNVIEEKVKFWKKIPFWVNGRTPL